jgi:hypothetical protein
LRTFRTLARHGCGRWSLAGGLAVEINWLLLAQHPLLRELNDIDFIAPDIASIPVSLSEKFLVRHLHPFAAPGKTIVQFVDPDTATRIDIFRACGGIANRSTPVELPAGMLNVLSTEDLVARGARLLLDIGKGIPVAHKHARDYSRLLGFADVFGLETAWEDHRKPDQPPTFGEARELIDELMQAHSDLLIDPEYSQDSDAACEQCVAFGGFRLADPKVVLSLLGYC